VGKDPREEIVYEGVTRGFGALTPKRPARQNPVDGHFLVGEGPKGGCEPRKSKVARKKTISQRTSANFSFYNGEQQRGPFRPK